LEKFLDPKEVALNRYKTVEPFLQRRATLEEISKQQNTPVRTLYNWVTAFKRNGLNGLKPKTRSDKGNRRQAQDDIINVIQGLYLRTPPVPITTIYRTVRDICIKNGWDVPSYDVVRSVVLEIPASLKTLAHEGAKAYKQAFGLLHRFEADGPNEIWQADHTPLDIKVLDSQKQALKPWLTAIVDDYSRAVPGYYLGLEPPSSVRIALALRQAIWRKEEANWTICGIPDKFYSDNGSDFLSNHIDQVAIDLKFETIQTETDDPQGKGKCERFFLTVNEMLLSRLPGYAPEGYGNVEAVLTIEQLKERFKTWLTSEYLVQEHSETKMPPKDRWESFPFVPRMPDSIEQLDLLLLTVAKTRRVRRDGIRFSGFRYFDVSLSGYVGEDVTIRYDPRDLAQIHVYANDSLICRASCFELSGKTVSLKEVRQARNHEAKIQRQQLTELLAVADKHSPVERPSDQTVHVGEETPTAEYPKLKIRRFACDND
jgi:putative transposase